MARNVVRGCHQAPMVFQFGVRLPTLIDRIGLPVQYCMRCHNRFYNVHHHRRRRRRAKLRTILAAILSRV